MQTTETLDCGHPPSPSTLGTGYGVTPEGQRHCYACCASNDRARMIETGRITLYLVKRAHPENPSLSQYFVTDWTGKLEFRVGGAVRHSPHGGGFGSQRTDAWFTGPDGKTWHTINRGDMHLARCKRIAR